MYEDIPSIYRKTWNDQLLAFKFKSSTLLKEMSRSTGLWLLTLNNLNSLQTIVPILNDIKVQIETIQNSGGSSSSSGRDLISLQQVIVILITNREHKPYKTEELIKILRPHGVRESKIMWGYSET